MGRLLALALTSSIQTRPLLPAGRRTGDEGEPSIEPNAHPSMSTLRDDMPSILTAQMSLTRAACSRPPKL